MAEKELRYPLTLGDTDKWIKFTPFVYSRSSRRQKNATARNFKQGVVLPLPDNLSNSYSANYSNQEQGGVARISAAGGEFLTNNGLTKDKIKNKIKNHVAKRTANGSKFANPKGTMDALKEIGESLLQTPAFADMISAQGDAATASMMDTFNLAVPGVDIEATLSGMGYTRNPHMATLYTGVDFKGHNFTFNLNAKNKKETDEIRDIIKTFKLAMAPEIGFTNNLLQYPYEFQIHFFNQSNTIDGTTTVTPVDGGYLFTIGACVLTSFEVDYHSQGKAIYFKENQAPVSVTISLSFQETTIVTRKDIEDFGR